MQEEIRSLQASDAAAVDEESKEQTTHGVSSHYNRVLDILREERCSMANAFRLARYPHSTIRDFVAIAELKIVDARFKIQDSRFFIFALFISLTTAKIKIERRK